MKQGAIQSLDDLNRYFRAWLERMYHQRTHSTLKKRPAAVLETHGQLRLVDPFELEDAFQWSYPAKVDKTACIRVQGNTYEVEPILVGQTVALRYDPFNLARIQVWLDNKRYADATPLKMRRHTDKRVTRAESLIPEPPSEPGISFLETIAKEHEQQQRQDLGRTSFSRAMKAGAEHDD